MQPYVSVIIPVYNGESFLANAIEMVHRQNYHPLEIIVVDDGSTDKTAEVAAQSKVDIRYIYQSNQGPAAARNRALQIAKGDIFAFLDVDDTWIENSFAKMLAYLDTHPSIEIVQGLIQQIHDPHIKRLDKSRKDDLQSTEEPYYFINLTSALYRRSAFDKVGLLDKTLRYGEDLDWFLRAWENKVTKETTDIIFLNYYKHSHNMTRNKNLVELGLVQVFKRRKDRLSQIMSQQPHDSRSFPTLHEYIYPKAESKID